MTDDASSNDEMDYQYNIFVKEVTEAIDNQHFNVAVSKMMIFINSCYKQSSILKDYMISFLIVLSCFAPFIAQELYINLTRLNDQVAFLKWPDYDQTKVVKNLINLPISINGKFKFTVEVTLDISEDKLHKVLASNQKYQELLKNQSPKKIIYVKNKILNIIL